MEIFKCKQDYRIFQERIERYREKYPVNIHIYCLMPNHFHFLIQETDNGPFISQFMQQLQNSYARFFALKYEHSGGLMQGKFRSRIILNEKHYNTVFKYIAENPLKAGLVSQNNKWPYMSTHLRGGSGDHRPYWSLPKKNHPHFDQSDHMPQSFYKSAFLAATIR